MATVSNTITKKKLNNNPMMLTPNRNRNQKKNNRISKDLHEKFADAHKIAQPESESDYMELDFVSRCAVAGIQLGRSKVFLRREAFDRIEAMRSQAFIWSASTIQAMVRGKIYRERFKAMRCAAVQIQAVARGYVTKRLLEQKIVDDAAIKIQRRSSIQSLKSLFKSFQHLIEVLNSSFLTKIAMRTLDEFGNKACPSCCEEKDLISSSSSTNEICKNHIKIGIGVGPVVTALFVTSKSSLRCSLDLVIFSVNNLRKFSREAVLQYMFINFQRGS